jgi:hypothetical protein
MAVSDGIRGWALGMTAAFSWMLQGESESVFAIAQETVMSSVDLGVLSQAERKVIVDYQRLCGREIGGVARRL